MAKHCFIDESGTLPEQKFMTVALTMLDGTHSAEKIHPRLTRSIFSAPQVRGQKELEKWYENQRLHFTDMSMEQKLAAGQILSQANISTIVGYFRHNTEHSTHDLRFKIYRELLKLTIVRTFELHEELFVSIAKQGGWESYGFELLQELRTIPKQLSKLGNFRKGHFFLSSPSKKGQQIADFYASSAWNYLLAGQTSTKGAPFELIRHQVIHFEELKL